MNEQNESIRRVVRQNADVVLGELDRLHGEARQREEVISMQKSHICTLESEKRDLEGDTKRAEQWRDKWEKLSDESIKSMILSWICAGIAIGYAVWMG